MSYHDKSKIIQNKTNSQGEIAPPGYHYMPDGTLMSDAEMLSSPCTFSDLMAMGMQTVHPVYIGPLSNNPGAAGVYFSFINNMWNHFAGNSPGPTGCDWWIDRWNLWTSQLPGITNPYQLALKEGKIALAWQMIITCGCPDLPASLDPAEKAVTSWNCNLIGDHPKLGYGCFEAHGNSGQFSTKLDCIESGCQGTSPSKTKQNNITSFNIDTTSFHPKGEVRDFSILGDPGAVFTLTIKNETPHYYNFKTRSFQSSQTIDTKIHQQVIPKTGVYKSEIIIPSISDDDHYIFQIYAESHFNTDMVFSDSLLYEKTIYQYDEVSVTFAPISKGYSGRYKTMPADLVITRAPLKAVLNEHPTETNRDGSTDISWTFESQPAVAETFALKTTRQPLETDYEIYQTQTVDGTTSSSKLITLDSLGDLFEGMYITGSGVTSTPPIILSINTETKTITVDTNQSISDTVTLTFWGGGKDNIEQFSDIGINFSNLTLRIDPLTITVNGSTATSRNITLDDAEGIRVDSDIEIEGIGFDNSTTQRSTSVDYSTKVMQVTSNQSLEDGTILKIKGVGKKATVTTKANISRMPSSNLTIQFDIDSVLTASTS